MEETLNVRHQLRRCGAVDCADRIAVLFVSDCVSPGAGIVRKVRALLTQVQSVQCTAGPCSDGPLFGKIANYDT